MTIHNVVSEDALTEGGGEATQAIDIEGGAKVRLDGPNGLVYWARVTRRSVKPKTVWLWLRIPGYTDLHIRPRHDDMFAVRRER